MVETKLTSDLIGEILSWVPARSLVRLKEVSKHWKTLIADPIFVNKHLSHMRDRDQQFTVFNDVSTASPGTASTVSCVGIDFNELNKPCLDVHVFNPCDLSVINMCHCDGLLLYVMSSKLLVLNPLLKQARWIGCGDGFDHKMDAYGLGYVSSNQSSSGPNDYKMVRFRCALPFSEVKEARVEVYDFKTDAWKVVVGDDSFVGFHGLPVSSVCLRGTPYWIGHMFNGATFSIQSFDFSKEEFESLALPSSSIQRTDSFSLGLFRGDQLSLLCKSGSTGRINMWVMWERHCWSMLVTIAMPEVSMCHIYSSCLIANEGKVVLSGRPFDIASISIYILRVNQEDEKLEYYSGKNHTMGTCYYVPSLLQVPGSPRLEEEEE